MKILLDENIHGELLSFLRNQEHDVKIGPKGSRDTLVFELAQQEHRILITRDSDFLQPAYLFRPHCGIILIRISPWDVERQKRILVQVLNQFLRQEEAEGKVIKLENSGYKII